MIIIGVATGFAFLSQVGETITVESARAQSDSLFMRKAQALESMRKIFFVLSFLVLWFFSAFTTNGTDRASYARIFLETGLGTLKEGFLEPGFQIFNLLVRFWSTDVQVFYIIISTITLGLIYSTLYFLRKEIKIGYAVLAYGCLFYVQGFSPLRSYLAAAMLFWGIRFLKRQQYMKYAVVILFTSLTHYSVLILFLPLCILYLLYHQKYEMKVNVFLITCMFIITFLLMGMGETIFSAIPMITRFQHYFENISFAQIGVAQFVYYLPLCVFLMMIWNILDDNYKRIFTAFLLSAFLIGMMSYLIHILGRAFSLFQLLYLWMIPYGLKQWKQWTSNKLLNCGVQIGLVLYYILRFYIYIREYKVMEQVLPYTNRFF